MTSASQLRARSQITRPVLPKVCINSVCRPAAVAYRRAIATTLILSSRILATPVAACPTLDGASNFCKSGKVDGEVLQCYCLAYGMPIVQTFEGASARQDPDGSSTVLLPWLGSNLQRTLRYPLLSSSLSPAYIRQVLQAHSEGSSLRGVSRTSRLADNTVVSIIRAASHRAR
jgi:hypothetical protein